MGGVHAAGAEEGDFHEDVVEQLGGVRSGQSQVTVSHPTAGHHDVNLIPLTETGGSQDGVGDDLSGERLGDEVGDPGHRGAQVEEQGPRLTDQLGSQLRHGRLLSGVKRQALLEGRLPGVDLGTDPAAVHPLHETPVLQCDQVAADRLPGDSEAIGQLVDPDYPAVGEELGDLETPLRGHDSGLAIVSLSANRLVSLAHRLIRSKPALDVCSLPDGPSRSHLRCRCGLGSSVSV